VSIGRSIISHGRWKLRFDGQGNHAGTTLMADRHDPMIAAAGTILAAQEVAEGAPGARATVGKIVPVPGGSNVIASAVELWLDVRHADEASLRPLVDEITSRAGDLARSNGCSSSLSRESYSPTAFFDAGLVERMSRVLPAAPLLDSGAGHDAGVLAPNLPTAMLFVRNPSGVSHSPQEHAEDEDVDAGAEALALVLADLSGG
jgi:N-carbamoyl-L-amino-acid hydrolase